LNGIQSSIIALAVHPKKPILAIAGDRGWVILWDYVKKDYYGQSYENYSKDSHEKSKDGKPSGVSYSCMQFTPDGTQLMVATSSGNIIIFDPETAKEIKQPTPICLMDDKEANNKNFKVTQMIISDDGLYCATSDSSRAVCLFKYSKTYEQEDKQVEWWFIGKHRTHSREITSICFGYSLDENNQIKHRLFSIGKDRRLFEYDTSFDATNYSHLKHKPPFDIELESIPTACIWYPNIDLKEGLILTANDEYKMKLWNPTTENSRRTCLGPTYGGAINKLKLLSFGARGEKYLLYST
jgi:WD40 repeat protein